MPAAAPTITATDGYYPGPRRTARSCCAPNEACYVTGMHLAVFSFGEGDRPVNSNHAPPRAARVRTINADGSLAAVVVSETPLWYDDVADRLPDAPMHVRAGSSLAWVPAGIAVIQDDASYVAIVATDGRVTHFALPANATGDRRFEDARGNKKQKPDLEACVSIPTERGMTLLARGSGSSRQRERIAVVEWTGVLQPAVSFCEATGLYAMLRETTAFAGSQLNVEGAVCVAGVVRLFNRGNGSTRGTMQPVNATCDISLTGLLCYLRAPASAAVPAVTNVVRYDLGSLQDVPLGFTDATVHADTVLYSASAENTADAVADGPVAGSAIGIIGRGAGARWATLTRPDGTPYRAKVEGLLGSHTQPSQLFLVVDADDPELPSTLCIAELRGPWLR